jgi:hypothetical protein
MVTARSGSLMSDYKSNCNTLFKEQKGYNDFKGMMRGWDKAYGAKR